MKNLKQVLALGMAFSLSLSTLASAAFTDQESINKNNADAIELLTTLDIIQGYEDGSFRPENTVTRAQMAKMIYTIRNGGNDNADAYKTVTTSFDDIQGHWAEGYIKYLQNTGIVSGKSTTKFRPDQTVTTAEAMKMALVLGGYRAEKANLTGADWLNNTVALATTNRLTDKVVSPMAGNCTRQDAAQILANALSMTAVQWSELVNGFVNDGNTGLAIGGEKITVGYKWMDLTTYVGRLESSGDLSIDGGDAGNNQFRVDVETVNDVRRNGTVTFKDGKDHTDLVGQEVKVLTGDKIDRVYGVYPTGNSQVVETTMNAVAVDEDNKKLKVGDNKYNVDFNRGTVYTTHNDATTTVVGTFGKDGRVASDKVKMIDWDNDGKFETVLVETVSVAKVTYVGTDSITIGQVGSRDKDIVKNKKTFDNSEINAYDGIAKGDYVVITKDDYNNEKWNIEKATAVTGTVDGVVKNDRKVRVDGTWYTLANNKVEADKKTDKDLYTIPGSVTDFKNKDNVTLYTIGDVAYYAESSKGNDANRQILMVYNTKVASGQDGWGDDKKSELKVLLADGSKKTVKFAKGDKDGSIQDASTIKKGGLYGYKVTNDDEYRLYELNNNEKFGYDAVVRDTDGVDNGNKYGGRYLIDDDAIVFAYISNKNDAEIYTGRQIKNLNRSGFGAFAEGVALVDDSYTRMMNISITENDKLNSTSNYGYLVTDATFSYNKDMKSDVMEYSFWDGKEVVNAIEKTSNNKESDLTKGTVIAFNKGDENMIKDVKAATEFKGSDKLHYAAMHEVDLKGKNVFLIPTDDKPTTLEVTSDTQFIYVDSYASSTDRIGVQGDGFDYAVSADENGEYNVNVAYVGTNDGKVKFMVIDINGKLKNNVADTVSAEVEANNSSVNNQLQKGNVTLSGDQTLAGVEVPSGRTLKINGNLTIDNRGRDLSQFVVRGKLIVNGNIKVRDGATLSVTGGVETRGLDLAEGTTLDVADRATVKSDTALTGKGTVVDGNADGGITAGGSVYKVEKDVAATRVSK